LDHVAVLQRAEKAGGLVTVSELQAGLGWEGRRARLAVEQLVGQGVAWEDRQAQGEVAYWVAGIFTSTTT